ncbi:MAG: BlaI/MecI/CopY family transcriptional regulator [Alphaproteobacteria bacterium]
MADFRRQIGAMSRRLPQRERQIAEIVELRGEASASEILDALPDPISNAAVRSMLSRLEAKGVIRRRREGKRFLYRPTEAGRAARDAALRRVSRDFFDGSIACAAAAMIALRDAEQPEVPGPSRKGVPAQGDRNALATGRPVAGRENGSAAA